MTLQLTTIYQHQLKSQHTTHGNVSAKFTIKVIDLNAAFDYTFNHENATTKTKQTTKTVTESVGKTYVVYDAVRYGKLGADHMRCSNDGRSTKKLGSTEAHSFTDEKIGTIVCTGTPYPKKGTVGYYLRGTHWCKP
ncbi:hypothetical protein ABZT28_52735 [Streptomyces sp. NPDC005388]|uniref:hypothetical protein n=1 Tax=Streptomyces sp. NPDC005388 TaxID=3156717 RepID=UPI0033BF449B